MTGFGAADGSGGPVAIRAELRSVNHRYLQVKSRVPLELVHLEPEIEALVRKKLSRGAVTAHVAVECAPGAAVATVQAEVARSYKLSIEAMAREVGLDGPVTLDHVLGLPGVVFVDMASEATRRQGKAVLRIVGEALERLIEMRAREGEAMEADLRKNANSLARTVGRIEKRLPQVVKRAHRALAQRVDDLVGDLASVAPADLSRELALIADRADVSEELSRLESHLAQLDQFLQKGGVIGRKLDFLVQEMFREVNTIGSKCGDAKVAHLVVDAKTAIERLREQVQNVE